MVQVERSVSWEVTVSLFVRKKVHVNMRVILNVYRERVSTISRAYFDRFRLWSWMENKCEKRKVNTPAEFVSRILNAATRKIEREASLRSTTRDLHTRHSNTVRLRKGFGNIYYEL